MLVYLLFYMLRRNTSLLWIVIYNRRVKYANITYMCFTPLPSVKHARFRFASDLNKILEKYYLRIKFCNSVPHWNRLLLNLIYLELNTIIQAGRKITNTFDNCFYKIMNCYCTVYYISCNRFKNAEKLSFI